MLRFLQTSFLTGAFLLAVSTVSPALLGSAAGAERYQPAHAGAPGHARAQVQLVQAGVAGLAGVIALSLAALDGVLRRRRAQPEDRRPETYADPFEGFTKHA